MKSKINLRNTKKPRADRRRLQWVDINCSTMIDKEQQGKLEKLLKELDITFIIYPYNKNPNKTSDAWSRYPTSATSDNASYISTEDVIYQVLDSAYNTGTSSQ